MKEKQAGDARRIGWSDIMRVHVESIGKADRATGRWTEAGEVDSSRPGEGAAAPSIEGSTKDGEGLK